MSDHFEIRTLIYLMYMKESGRQIALCNHSFISLSTKLVDDYNDFDFQTIKIQILEFYHNVSKRLTRKFCCCDKHI